MDKQVISVYLVVLDSRSGKTFILIFAIIVRACKVKSRHAILRQTFNSAKISIWMDTLPKVLSICFPDLLIKWNRTDFVVTFPNGSEVFVGGLDDEKRVEKILGREFSTLYFNESSQLSYSSVQIALTRLAEKNSLVKKVYYDLNPNTKSSWPYLVFEKGLDPIENEPLKDNYNYISFRMNPKDNLENIDEEYLSLLEKMSEADRNRFLLGEYSDESDGQVYYSFRRDLHAKETQFIPGTMFIGMDFNVDPSTCVILQVIEDELHVHDEIFLRNSDTYQLANKIIEKGYRGAIVIPDSTGKNRKTSGKSDFAILEEFGFTIQWNRNPFVKDRINNVNRLLTNGKIIINPKKCTKLINDLERVSWKDNKLDQKGESKLLTHISDCLGYAAFNLFPLDRVVDNKFNIRKML